MKSGAYDGANRNHYFQGLNGAGVAKSMIRKSV